MNNSIHSKATPSCQHGDHQNAVPDFASLVHRFETETVSNGTSTPPKTSSTVATAMSDKSKVASTINAFEAVIDPSHGEWSIGTNGKNEPSTTKIEEAKIVHTDDSRKMLTDEAMKDLDQDKKIEIFYGPIQVFRDGPKGAEVESGVQFEVMHETMGEHEALEQRQSDDFKNHSLGDLSKHSDTHHLHQLDLTPTSSPSPSSSSSSSSSPATTTTTTITTITTTIVTSDKSSTTTRSTTKKTITTKNAASNGMQHNSTTIENNKNNNNSDQVPSVGQSNTLLNHMSAKYGPLNISTTMADMTTTTATTTTNDMPTSGLVLVPPPPARPLSARPSTTRAQTQQPKMTTPSTLAPLKPIVLDSEPMTLFNNTSTTTTTTTKNKQTGTETKSTSEKSCSSMSSPSKVKHQGNKAMNSETYPATTTTATTSLSDTSNITTTPPKTNLPKQNKPSTSYHHYRHHHLTNAPSTSSNTLSKIKDNDENSRNDKDSSNNNNNSNSSTPTAFIVSKAMEALQDNDFFDIDAMTETDLLFDNNPSRNALPTDITDVMRRFSGSTPYADNTNATSTTPNLSSEPPLVLTPSIYADVASAPLSQPIQQHQHQSPQPQQPQQLRLQDSTSDLSDVSLPCEAKSDSDVAPSPQHPSIQYASEMTTDTVDTSLSRRPSWSMMRKAAKSGVLSPVGASDALDDMLVNAVPVTEQNVGTLTKTSKTDMDVPSTTATTAVPTTTTITTSSSTLSPNLKRTNMNERPVTTPDTRLRGMAGLRHSRLVRAAAAAGVNNNNINNITPVPTTSTRHSTDYTSPCSSSRSTRTSKPEWSRVTDTDRQSKLLSPTQRRRQQQQQQQQQLRSTSPSSNITQTSSATVPSTPERRTYDPNIRRGSNNIIQNSNNNVTPTSQLSATSRQWFSPQHSPRSQQQLPRVNHLYNSQARTRGTGRLSASVVDGDDIVAARLSAGLASGRLLSANRNSGGTTTPARQHHSTLVQTPLQQQEKAHRSFSEVGQPMELLAENNNINININTNTTNNSKSKRVSIITQRGASTTTTTPGQSSIPSPPSNNSTSTRGSRLLNRKGNGLVESISARGLRTQRNGGRNGRKSRASLDGHTGLMNNGTNLKSPSSTNSGVQTGGTRQTSPSPSKSSRRFGSSEKKKNSRHLFAQQQQQQQQNSPHSSSSMINSNTNINNLLIATTANMNNNLVVKKEGNSIVRRAIRRNGNKSNNNNTTPASAPTTTRNGSSVAAAVAAGACSVRRMLNFTPDRNTVNTTNKQTTTQQSTTTTNATTATNSTTESEASSSSSAQQHGNEHGHGRARVTVPKPFHLTGESLQQRAQMAIEEARRRTIEVESRRRVFRARPMPDFSKPFPPPKNTL